MPCWTGGGLKPQKTLQRACQRDPQAIERWQRELVNIGGIGEDVAGGCRQIVCGDHYPAAECGCDLCGPELHAHGRDAIVADLKANGDRVERLLVGGFSDGEKAALRDYVARMRANIERAQREFEHQTLPQSPVVMAPDQDGAEVANTKEENE